MTDLKIMHFKWQMELFCMIEVIPTFLQMDKKHTVQNVALGKDTCVVTVYPNVNHAFIVALVVILHEINEEIQAAS